MTLVTTRKTDFAGVLFTPWTAAGLLARLHGGRRGAGRLAAGPPGRLSGPAWRCTRGGPAGSGAGRRRRRRGRLAHRRAASAWPRVGVDLSVGRPAGRHVGRRHRRRPGGRRLIPRRPVRPPGRPGDARHRAHPDLSVAELWERMAPIYAESADDAERRRRLGRLALDADTVDEAVRRRVIAARLDGLDWAGDRVSVVAVEATTGRRRVFDRHVRGGRGRRGGRQLCGAGGVAPGDHRRRPVRGRRDLVAHQHGPGHRVRPGGGARPVADQVAARRAGRTGCRGRRPSSSPRTRPRSRRSAPTCSTRPCGSRRPGPDWPRAAPRRPASPACSPADDRACRVQASAGPGPAGQVPRPDASTTARDNGRARPRRASHPSSPMAS